MKVCIIGAGALGSVIGGTLAEGGHDVVLVSRNRAHVEAINRSGLVVGTGGVDRIVRVKAAANAPQGVLADLVIVLVKSFDTREAVADAIGIVGPETTVLSLQNGLGHEDILADLVGRDRVIAGKTYVGGALRSHGHVIAGIEGKETIIGEVEGGITDRVQRIADAFGQAGLKTIVSSNIQGAMWDKLLVNVATGALSAVTHLNYGQLYKVPEIEHCAVAAVREAMAVARALGVTLSTTLPEAAWRKAAEGLAHDFKASMLQSVEKGSKTEIDFVNGAVVRAGASIGIPTPVNATLVACIKGIEQHLKIEQANLAPARQSAVSQR